METVSLLLLVVLGQSPTDDKSARPVPYTVLEPTKILDRETFWENRDREWFRGNIPLLETPDPAINEPVPVENLVSANPPAAESRNRGGERVTLLQ
jgi:hypothetical protein